MLKEINAGFYLHTIQIYSKEEFFILVAKIASS